MKDSLVSDLHLAARLSAEYTAARHQLRQHMRARCLYESDGWGIAETTRRHEGKLQLVLRPVHLRLPAPVDLECVVSIDDATETVEGKCVG